MENPEKKRFLAYSKNYCDTSQPLEPQDNQVAANTQGAQSKRAKYGKATMTKEGMRNVSGAKAPK